MTYEFFIIGGGIHGLAIGYELIKKGYKVALAEAKYIGYGSSGRCFGGIRTLHDNEDDTILAKISRNIWVKLTHELRHNLLIRKTPYIFLIPHNKEKISKMEKMLSLARKYNISAKVFTPTNLEIPFLTCKGIYFAVVHQEALSAHPHYVLEAYKEEALKHGLELYTYTKITDIKKQNNIFRLISDSKKQFKADNIIITAGSGSQKLLNILGYDYKFRIIKREAIVTEPIKKIIQSVIVAPEIAITQTARGEILADYYGVDIYTTPDDLSISINSIKIIAKRLLDLFPKLSNLCVIRGWAGHYVASPDRKPIIGGINDIYLSVGWEHHGFMLAPAVSRLLTKLILYNKVDKVLEPYLPTRFNKNY